MCLIPNPTGQVIIATASVLSSFLIAFFRQLVVLDRALVVGEVSFALAGMLP